MKVLNTRTVRLKNRNRKGTVSSAHKQRQSKIKTRGREINKRRHHRTYDTRKSKNNRKTKKNTGQRSHFNMKEGGSAQIASEISAANAQTQKTGSSFGFFTSNAEVHPAPPASESSTNQPQSNYQNRVLSSKNPPTSMPVVKNNKNPNPKKRNSINKAERSATNMTTVQVHRVATFNANETMGELVCEKIKNTIDGVDGVRHIVVVQNN